MALLDDILATAKKNPYGTNTGDTSIDALGNQANSSLATALNQLYQTNNSGLNDLNNQMAPIQQNLAAVPAKYQPQYDQNAVTEQSNLKRALENAANYGQLGGGAYQQWQLDASGNRQNADTAVNANKASDLTNYGNQINDLTGKINTFNSNGQNDLASLLSKSSSDYNGAVNVQKNNEAAAAQAEYDKQMALQNAYNIAQINHSGSGTTVKAPATPTVSDFMKNFAGNYTNVTKGIDPQTGYATGTTTSTISDPDALINAITSSGLSQQDQINLVAQYPYKYNGITLAQYIASPNRTYISPSGNSYQTTGY
jgi:hypothetical protein